MICLPEHVRPASRLLRSERSPLYRLALFPLNPILLALLLPPVDDVAEQLFVRPGYFVVYLSLFFWLLLSFLAFLLHPTLDANKTRQ